MTNHLKNFVIGLLTMSALLSFSAISQAGQGDFSAGLKFGNMDVDGGDSETALGIQLGYRATSRISAELEILQAEFGNRDADSTAVYGTYRSAGDIYLLGKIGFASLDGAGESESGLSFGLGAGIATGNGISIEAEYTVLDSDVSFFGLTGKISF